MIRQVGLFDPIRRTRDMEEREFTKYTDIRDEQKAKNTPTDKQKIEKIWTGFYKAHENIDVKKLDEMWAFIHPMLEGNAGLTEFVLDYGGEVSDFFFPWLKSVATSPSEALEMSYGAGYDLSGEWTHAPEDDNIDFFVRNDPTFVYNRERQLFVANLVTIVRDRAITAKEFSKVVDLGAGRMAWARWHGFEFDPKNQAIYAFDKDPSIQPSTLFRDAKVVPGLANPSPVDGGVNSAAPSLLGLVYEKADMHSALSREDCREADLIMLGGVASYYPMSAFAENMIKPVYQLLKPGGTFFFDLQVSCPYLKRSMRIFNWPELVNFAASAADAIKLAEDVRKNLWKQGIKFVAEYSLDTYNEVPSSVMITFTKI